MKSKLGVGVDMENVGRFRQEVKAPSRFLSKAFTSQEFAYCMSKADPSKHFAGTFAAKEATIKSLGTLQSGPLKLEDFKVTRGKQGAPKITYTGTIEAFRRAEISVSISHTADSAVAIAISVLRP